jgi:hypothetical protein
MTRRGSLAYYACALVLGSFFISVAFYLYLAQGTPRGYSVRDFCFTFFFALPLALVPLLLSSWVLRRLAMRAAWKVPWAWLAAGTVIFLGVTVLLGAAGRFIQSPAVQVSMPVRTALFAPFAGAWFAAEKPLWLLLGPALATSYFLYRVHRAFDR